MKTLFSTGESVESVSCCFNINDCFGYVCDTCNSNVQYPSRENVRRVRKEKSACKRNHVR